MTENILFLHEKYCDADITKGITNNYHNLLSSFKRSQPEIPFNALHFDESLIYHNIHIDALISKVYEKYKPSIVMMSLMNHPSSPTINTFKYLKDKGCKIVVHWPDLGQDWGVPQVEQLGNLVDLHVGWDNAESEFHNNRQMPDNFVQLWVPQDPKLYNKSDLPQDLNVTFIGSTRYKERQMFLQHAINVGMPVLIRGGQREEKLSQEQYANLIKRSKISTNFSWCPGGFHQCKGRVFEVLASNSMLLEMKNNATAKLFTPGKDYVEFESPDDFVQKMKYYLEHDEERKQIAENGYNIYNQKYSAKMFWNEVLKRLK